MRPRPNQIGQIADPPAGGTPLELLSCDDIKDISSRSAFSKGERYWRQDRVVSLTVEEDGARIKARVRGSLRRPYSLNIELKQVSKGLLDIAGLCSCPIGFNCKHVVAALFAAIARDTTTDDRSLRLPASGSAWRASDVLGLLPGFNTSRVSQAQPAEVLAPDLAAWIDMLARLEQTETEDYPPEIRHRLIYVLDLEQRTAGTPHLIVFPTSVRLLKDDRFSDRTAPFSPQASHQQNVAKFLRPSDRDILKRLYSMQYAAHVPTGTALVGEDGVAALEAMIETDRARWGSVAGAVVSKGPVRQGRLAWRLADDGSQYPDFELEEAGGPASFDSHRPGTSTSARPLPRGLWRPVLRRALRPASWPLRA